MKQIDVAEIRLNVFDEGSGPPLVFVHGFPLSHAMWLPQLQAFRTTHRVVAPDLRGFGGSTVVPGESTMRCLADDVAGLLDALGITEPVVLCGLSMGGYVAWQFVKHHAARLKALVVCDTKAVADAPEAAETRRKMAEHVLKFGTGAVAEAMPAKLFTAATHTEQPQIVADIRATIAATDPQGLAAAQLGMAEREDVRSFLASIRVPALVVVGRDDVISPVEEMRAIAASIPGAEFRIVEGAGHMAPLERPEEFNSALAAFVDGLK